MDKLLGTIMQKKNILISDANHGGLILLEEYYKFTKNNLFFYDIYNKLSIEEKKEYTERFNVTFLSLEEIKVDEDSFVKINPIHMPPIIGTDFTHHEFVGYLLSKRNFSFKIIQVTGVKGKTTVTSLVKDILSDYNTLVLTSNSLVYNDCVLLDYLSIAPSSIITAINKAEEEGVLDSIDFCVFEVSLGVVPGYDLGVLTNIVEDYPIAKNSGSASVAKRSVFSSNLTLCDLGAFEDFYFGLDAVTLSLDNSDADIFASDIKYGIENTEFTLNYFDKKFNIKHFALSDFYINNLLFAISVGLLLNIDENVIISNLEKSNSVKGRNSYKKIDDKIIIEDINPGLNTTSIRKCVENLEKFNEEYLIIIGGDYGITCEEIDEEKLVKYLESIQDKKIIFTGKLGENLEKKMKEDYPVIPLLNDVMKYSLKENREKLIQVIYRSEYNKHDKDLSILDNIK